MFSTEITSIVQFSSVQSLSRVRLFATPWTAARQASLSITNSQSSLRLTSIESVMPSSHLILCRPILLLPPIPPSIRVFSNESTLCMRWPKYWRFSFSINPSKEHPGLISFRMDWLGLLAVQGMLKSLLQHHSSEASILWHSAVFTVQLSNPYMTTGKTIALTRRTFVGKVMSLLLKIPWGHSFLMLWWWPYHREEIEAMLLFHSCSHFMFFSPFNICDVTPLWGKQSKCSSAHLGQSGAMTGTQDLWSLCLVLCKTVLPKSGSRPEIYIILGSPP